MAEPAHVQTTAFAEASSASSVSISVTTGAGTDRALVAGMYARDSTAANRVFSTCVFNTSENFTLYSYSHLTSVWSNGNASLPNPSASTTANVVLTCAGTCLNIAVIVSEYTGVHQTTPFENTGGTEGNSADIDHSINVTDADAVFVATQYHTNTGALAVDAAVANQTLRAQLTTAATDKIGYSHRDTLPTGSTGTAIDQTSSGAWVTHLASLVQPSAGGGGTILPIVNQRRR